ncbi:MAG: lipoyl synthase [Candidatus Tectomicrobia bacterium]|uniref:Lipoyl synthase n=1 Tax=Tectimicrobiota bacterium TaxID=2528274 RepID=A0A933GL65_UNCTE|nr:lipoyl synthase [Candidatus Tectomicrobia bacterium]
MDESNVKVENEEKTLRKPPWLIQRISFQNNIHQVKQHLRQKALHTVCEAAACPNIFDCFSRNTATFLIMGDQCTRRCGFCAVSKNPPLPLDPEEPARVAQMVKEMSLKHAVITSPSRDDLFDGGAGHFAQTVHEIKRLDQDITIEVLTPDFGGNWQALALVIESRPDVFNHNIETVPRLYPKVRPQASYSRSLELLKRIKGKAPDLVTKSGLMVGLGETRDEVFGVMADLLTAKCEVLTIGQYLRPSRLHLPVVEYLHPDIFEIYRQEGEKLGFRAVASSPMVRSSFHAMEVLKKLTD